MRPVALLVVPSAFAFAAACGAGPTPASRAPELAAPSAPAGSAGTAVRGAASGAASAPVAAPSAAAARHLATVDALVAGINAHDPRKMATAYAADAELTVIPGAGTLRGRDAIAADWGPYFQAFPDFRFAVRRAWLTDEVAIVEWVGVGTNSGDFLGLKATGRPAGQASLAVLWFSPEGLIAREHLYEDGAAMLAQLSGQQPAPPIPGLPDKARIAYGGGDEGNGALAVGRRYMDAWQRGDQAGQLALLADDYQFDTAMAPVPDKGKDEARRALERFATAFPDARPSISGQWGVGDDVIFEYALQGTHDGPLGPIAPTHRKVDWHWVRILEVPRGTGKIARGWGYANTIELMGELGAMGSAPAPEGPPPKKR